MVLLGDCETSRQATMLAIDIKIAVMLMQERGLLKLCYTKRTNRPVLGIWTGKSNLGQYFFPLTYRHYHTSTSLRSCQSYIPLHHWRKLQTNLMESARLKNVTAQFDYLLHTVFC